MIFDLHCDTLYELYKKKKAGEALSLASSELAIDEKKLSLGNYTAQCFAAWVTQRHENPYLVCKEIIEIFREELKKSEILAPVSEYTDVIRNMENKKISAILSLEDAMPIGTDMERLREFYELGVRMIALVWNYPNPVGYPNNDMSKPVLEGASQIPDTVRGLTEFGRELVSEMNRLGIIVDVSHLSDAGFYDVCEISRKPFVASHSNARSVCSHVRNMTDHMLKKLAESGGVVGINYFESFMNNDKIRGRETVNCFIEHMKHIKNIIGYDHIALGSDFDGIGKGTELETAKDMPNLIDGLLRHGVSESDIEKITYKNALRVFRESI